ncbi:MAG: alpha-isopropylmalate synthase regulatory domain-containing protein, partial [bacterium]|nr:alpha-isopropylmalate synthase regulatory domain-containing protein [bacterium]
LQDLGVDLGEEDLTKAFQRFKELCDKKKEVFDDDLLAIVEEQVFTHPETYVLDHLQFLSGTNMIPTATVRLKKEDEIHQESGWGDGPVDATFKAIDQVTGMHPQLKDYGIRAVTSGKDALGEVMVSIEIDGQTIIGRGTSTDVIEASAKAYLNAINRAVGRKTPPEKEVKQGI